MAYDHSKLAHTAPFLKIVPEISEALDPMPDFERRELESLRSLNARLLRELAALKRREAEVLRLADRDALTGLYNRRRMLELLDAAIQEAARLRQHVGVLFVDLNGFKAINDEYGHAAGDRILTTVATRLCARVRIGDVVCRYGGDEFVVVLPNIEEPADVSRVADTIRQRVALPYWIQGQEQHLSAAIGESRYPQHGDDAATLLNRADRAMYAIKTGGSRAASSRSAPLPGLDRRRHDPPKSRSGRP